MTLEIEWSDTSSSSSSDDDEDQAAAAVLTSRTTTASRTTTTTTTATEQQRLVVLPWWTIGWTEAAGGAAAGAIADSVLYSLDSAKVRAQSPSAAATTTTARDVRILFRGLGPTVLLGSVPVFGSFFFLYAPLKQTLQHQQQQHWLLPMASGICAIPATLIGVPADVLKKRVVLGLDPNVITALRSVVAHDGIYRGLFAGWHVNLIRDIPFAGVKIGLYEFFVRHYQTYTQPQPSHPPQNDNQKHNYNCRISATGASLCGVASGVTCAIITCPLDVVNTRIKADTTTSHSTSIRTVAIEIVQREGFAALFRGVVMRSIVLGIGSSIFWPIQRTVAHSLQLRSQQ